MSKNKNQQNEQKAKTVNKNKVQDPPVPNRAHTEMKNQSEKR